MGLEVSRFDFHKGAKALLVVQEAYQATPDAPLRLPLSPGTRTCCACGPRGRSCRCFQTGRGGRERTAAPLRDRDRHETGCSLLVSGQARNSSTGYLNASVGPDRTRTLMVIRRDDRSSAERRAGTIQISCRLQPSLSADLCALPTGFLLDEDPTTAVR